MVVYFGKAILNRKKRRRFGIMCVLIEERKTYKEGGGMREVVENCERAASVVGREQCLCLTLPYTLRSYLHIQFALSRFYPLSAFSFLPLKI